MKEVYIVVRESPRYRQTIDGYFTQSTYPHQDYITTFGNFEDAYLYSQTDNNLKVIRDYVVR